MTDEVIKLARKVGAVHVAGESGEFAIVGNDMIKQFAELVRSQKHEHYTALEQALTRLQKNYAKLEGRFKSD